MVAKESEVRKILMSCIELMEERQAVYGDSWRGVRISSLLDYVVMKFLRVNKMIDDPIKNKQKIISDLKDAINYATMSIQKLEEEIK